MTSEKKSNYDNFCLVAESENEIFDVHGRTDRSECVTHIGSFKCVFGIADSYRCRVNSIRIEPSKITKLSEAAEYKAEFLFYSREEPDKKVENCYEYLGIVNFSGDELAAKKCKKEELPRQDKHRMNRILVISRIMKKRAVFTDFTTTEGHVLKPNRILKVRDQQFHVNKEHMASVSPSYFNQLFNGTFAEGGKENVGLQKMNANDFHEFLLVTEAQSPSNRLLNERVLPNVKTVDALLNLAEYFGVEFLKQECVDCLKHARELTFKDRLIMAKRYRLGDVQKCLVREIALLPLEQRENWISEFFENNDESALSNITIETDKDLAPVVDKKDEQDDDIPPNMRWVGEFGNADGAFAGDW